MKKVLVIAILGLAMVMGMKRMVRADAADPVNVRSEQQIFVGQEQPHQAMGGMAMPAEDLKVLNDARAIPAPKRKNGVAQMPKPMLVNTAAVPEKTATTVAELDMPAQRPALNMRVLWETTAALQVATMTADQIAMLKDIFGFFKENPTKDLSDFEKMNPTKKAALAQVRKAPGFKKIMAGLSQTIWDVQLSVMSNTWWNWLKKVKEGSVGATLSPASKELLATYFTFKLKHPEFVGGDVFEKEAGVQAAQAFTQAVNDKEFADIIENATKEVMQAKLLGPQVVWTDFFVRIASPSTVATGVK